MIIVGQDKPSLADLMQSGVKGMKWGVRKHNPSTSDIHNARLRQMQRSAAATNPQLSSKKRDAAAKDFHTNEDRVTAMHMTRGEKMTAVILAGPLGGALIVANKVQVKRAGRKTDVARIRARS